MSPNKGMPLHAYSVLFVSLGPNTCEAELTGHCNKYMHQLLLHSIIVQM